MARNNANCTANVYYETREILKVDRAFASDSDYYLNAIEASQQFYLSFLNWHLGFIRTLPIIGFIFGTPLELVKFAGQILFPIITLILQQDTEKLRPVANVLDQLKTELDNNGGKLPESSKE